MIRLFKHYIPHGLLLLGITDFALLVAACEAAWWLRAWQIGMGLEHLPARLGPVAVFAAALQLAMIAVGVYGVEALNSVRLAAARLLVAISIAVMLLSLLFFVAPPLALWRSHLLYALLFSGLLIVAARLALVPYRDGDVFKRRVLVLGAGSRAARIRALAERPGASFVVVGYVGMNDGPASVPGAVDRNDIESVADHVVATGAGEVVLALEERRNALPLADLLRIKTTGVHVNELSTFLERETGRVDLASTNHSALIFSDGFSAGQRLSSVAKRLFDVAVSGALLLLAAPVILLTAIAVKAESRGPALYRQKRVGRYGQEFEVVKLRSMRTDAEAAGQAIWAQEDDPRVTRVGRFIRKVRIDELPQAWTVLKGEMSFVGPRPERRQFIEDLERRLPFYAERHMVKPGITGWAQINYPYGASLEDARNKLEYDLYYVKNYSPFLDMLIILQTVRVLLWPDGAR